MKQWYDSYWNARSGWTVERGLSECERATLRTVLFPGCRVLDIGCGDGAHYAQYIAGLVGSYVGIDVSSVAVERARERGLEALVHDLSHPLPFENETFDVIVIFEVLEHLFDPEFVITEACRVLRGRGALVVSVPNVAHVAERVRLLFGRFNPGGSPATSTDRPWADPHIRFFTESSLRRLLKMNGFDGVDTEADYPGLLAGIPFVSPMSVRILNALGMPKSVAWQGLSRLSSHTLFVENKRPSLFARGLLAVARKGELP